MRTASGYQTPAVPYHTLICRSFSTPNTALVRKNAEYITNTKNSTAGVEEEPRNTRKTRKRCQGGAAHQLKVRSQGSLLVQGSKLAAAPQALVARPFVPLVASVPYLPHSFNSQQLTAGAERALAEVFEVFVLYAFC